MVNINAHLDARPLDSDGQAHSGSPFYQLLMDPRFKDDGGQFHEFAVQGNQCSVEHSEFVLQNHGQIKWLSQVLRNGARKEFQQVLDNL